MPFKSKAQKEWGKKQVREGKWTPEQYAEWAKDTPTKLPERVGGEPKGKAQNTEKIKTTKVIK